MLIIIAGVIPFGILLNKFDKLQKVMPSSILIMAEFNISVGYNTNIWQVL